MVTTVETVITNAPDELPPFDGAVLYADGSFGTFRSKWGGWGVHGYFYENIPLTQGIGLKQLPTTTGYQPVQITESVKPIRYVDALGSVDYPEVTNNVAELLALEKTLDLIERFDIQNGLILTDSNYVIKGLTQFITSWVTNNWRKKTGEVIANREHWERIYPKWNAVKEAGRTIQLEWVKGHSGNVGNDLADLNARTGSGGVPRDIVHVSDVLKYHNPETEFNPLILKNRMLFNFSTELPPVDITHGKHYYTYQLGRSSTYGNKQGDTVKDKHDKSDLLLGRRISDATFCVLHVPEPDSYLDQLMDMHANEFSDEIVDLAVVRLDNAYRPSIYQRINRFGIGGMIIRKSNETIFDPNGELITKTLKPPRLAKEAIDVFAIMERRLHELVKGTIGKGVTVVEITEHFFGDAIVKKKEVKQLHKTITSKTQTVDINVQFKDNDVVLRLLLGIDVPPRNNLAKIADVVKRVSVAIVANGPYSYTYATLFETDAGNAIYQSPYTQFVIPKPS